MNTAITPIAANFDVTLQLALRCSRYAQRLLDSEEELLPWLREHYDQPCSMDEMSALLAAMPVTDEDSLSSALRGLRKRVMLKLLTRDLGGLADLEEVMSGMSALAELTVQRAQHFIMESLEQQYGQPIDELSGEPQQLLVIGMGKLGGKELNVSSDIDLIFLYPEDGNSNGSRSISNHDFFSRLGRRLINLISELTQDGYVFRVDMRLRPYGDSGPLVMSFAAVEEYLVAQGREWERYAWIKARVISPADYPATQELMQLVQPFIFRKYLDFGAFESMRKLHAQISQEVQRRDRIDNIKLGSGGIREIEFIAQVFQLIRGGRDVSLRIRPTLKVLQLLSEHGQLTSDIIEALSEAYVFFRRLEHRLQYMDDQQTHDLPKNIPDQAILAEGMGYPDYAALLKQLNHHRSLVSGQFALIFNTQKDSTIASVLWHENLNVEELQNDLGKLGYTDTTTLAERLLHIRDSGRYKQLPNTSRQRIDKLIPQFITLCAEPNNRDQTLPRILNLLESISRRASYLAFLAEYPKVLPLLIELASASEWACEYLIKHPILLDELLDAREIYRVPDWIALDAELLTQLEQCNTDTERQMDVLRQFQHVQTFHLLAKDLQGLLPLETLSDHLSNLADLVLRHVLQICWRDASKKHQQQAQFAIIAYGKLGGLELGYSADLDLIFLYDDQHPDAAEIYAKLAQRINTLLSSYTSAGRLYEIDLRLRPNGASGLLVSSIPAFAEYQQDHAWVWEHQALTRARFCTGDPQVGEQFETIRNKVLCKSRDLNELRKEIVAMRQKMQDTHPNDSDMFDIKHDRGGMVDIEFIVQFLVLAHAHAQLELTANSGNLALLMLAGKLGLIKVELAEATSNCYRTLRALQHKMRLNSQSPCRVDRETIDITSVITLWEELLGPYCQVKQ
ncbi:bifunctional [glutamate--ammonia ligase]-adenylyl-L-tyrosine phosphorylase/[glutamate--ammonia-ligase] adenylyltransferase [Candidatus Nitrotoga sp. M5]|uniref:bifunctional [glutamate--ammonia ligase]-adenylyl-L-tyrosine phosphorylase/[glutamate--ammonia-ligase] adenylyltransferase n=1 Tax=Candidatus Nitrotoga sp. M5 TaxID=2890409 RepID=UPI001EF6356A|nr:bifunctional [glutamate--ammonia ligase]-adenylyl-L-tyrosine phosphorylase/[glutamate--ammonia-ligase] adenylyltransferase [Candidatus Nitrotoga sp. M5]CAH1387789.1 Glutamine synthetase adenylyl-L-tyrosine phosphorylase / Glutamine synthetase adenylyl transferase [Candidatus Nitrotoga sp. M5]